MKDTLTLVPSPSVRTLRPNWIDVDAGAIRSNVRTLKARVGPDVALFTTLKSNACGFDLEQAGPLLQSEASVDGIALVDLGDALMLRQLGITKSVLVFGGNLLDAASLALAEEHDIILTAHDPYSLEAIASCERKLEFVVEFNVGAQRLGFEPQEAGGVIQRVARSRSARLVGVTAHMNLPSSESALDVARVQYARFISALSHFDAARIALRYSLIASSKVLLLTNTMNLTAIDPGQIVFGMLPYNEESFGAKLVSALKAVKSRLIQAGDIGVFPFGASDGLARIACDHVLIRGRKAPLLDINAEHAKVDLTGLGPASVGDEVVIVGEQDGSRIDIEEIVMHHPQMRSPADTVRNLSPFIRRIYRE